MIDGQLSRERGMKLLDIAIQKMHTNLMVSKLKELDEEPLINPLYAPANMEDREYLFFISEVFLKDRESKQGTVDKIKEFCDEKKNIDGIFSIQQAGKLKEISPKIKHSEIRNFFEEELKRLGQSVPAGEVGIRVDSLLSQEDLAQKEKLAQQKRVDTLIGVHDAGREITLTQERFLMLTKEYASEVIILMQKTLSAVSVGGTRDRLNKIGGLIDSNKASLNFLSTENIEDKEELTRNVQRLIYSACYNGDIRSLKALIENTSDRNLLAVFVLTPLQKESDKDFRGLITLNGMISIIKERVDDTERKDSAEWKKVLDLFDRTVVKREEIKGLSDLSLVGQDDGGPAARSTRVRGVGSAENVARGNRGLGDGGPAKR